jgi:hypothetical protein
MGVSLTTTIAPVDQALVEAKAHGAQAGKHYAGSWGMEGATLGLWRIPVPIFD